MANGVFNVAKGRVNGYVDRVASNDPAASQLVVMLLKTGDTDGNLRDFDTFAAILAGAAVEADFTNYARKTLTDSALTAPTPDDANDRQNADFPDQTWASAGGTTDNTLARLIVGYDPLGTGVDANIVPLTFHDFVATTNGGDLIAQVDASGFYSAS